MKSLTVSLGIIISFLFVIQVHSIKYENNAIINDDTNSIFTDLSTFYFFKNK